MESPDDERNLKPPSFLAGMNTIELLNSFSLTDVLSSGTIQLFQSNVGLFSNVLRAMQDSLTQCRERMLDMGCGFGGLSNLLGEQLRFREIYGLDLNEERISVASHRGLKISHCNLEVDRFPFSDNYFDLVMSFGVLDHIKSLDNSISEAKRVLKLGGCLAI